jgi:cation diffusion facilitator family transporter
LYQYRNHIAAAVALNSVIFIVEAVAGFQAASLSLIMDAVHNLSDELALVFIYLAFVLTQRLSKNLLRTANIFNSVGLVLVAAVLLWQAIERLLNPTPVIGLVAVVVGLGAAVANYGVAWLLRKPGEHNAAVRLAYIHNMGDVWISLAPVLAGLLVMASGYPIFDPIVAGLVAIWFIGSTLKEVISSHEELIWPEELQREEPSPAKPAVERGPGAPRA